MRRLMRQVLLDGCVLSVSLREVSRHREFLRDQRSGLDTGLVLVTGSFEPIQHMPSQWVSFLQEGMIEVISRIARHAQFFHHPA